MTGDSIGADDSGKDILKDTRHNGGHFDFALELARYVNITHLGSRLFPA